MRKSDYLYTQRNSLIIGRVDKVVAGGGTMVRGGRGRRIVPYANDYFGPNKAVIYRDPALHKLVLLSERTKSTTKNLLLECIIHDRRPTSHFISFDI